MAAATISTAATDYRELVARVRDAGLLDRRPLYYSVKIAMTVAAFGAGWAALFAVGDSWFALAIAVWLALMFAQVVFLGHDAGHQQIFLSRRVNRRVGLLVGNLLTGLSFGWWVAKHNAHHAHPNQVDLDPDIGAGVIAFTPEVARTRRGAGRWLARRQAWLFFPLLLLEAVALHVSSVQALRRRRDRSASLEAALLVVHNAAYLTAVFWVLSSMRAAVFVVVQQAVFGLYLGCTFAPNHKGMPVIDRDAKVTFARRQVITTRNVIGGPFTTFMLGGLNYQIEHHLFPMMPRRNLARAQSIVRTFCAEQGLGYQEKSLVGSYRHGLRHLRTVGA